MATPCGDLRKKCPFAIVSPLNVGFNTIECAIGRWVVAMRVQIKNLGVIKEADFEVGDLTIICGINNTGKTYVNYALYGFLDFWWNAAIPKIENMEEIKKSSKDEMDAFSQLSQEKNAIVANAIKEYAGVFPVAFASTKLGGSSFSVDISTKELNNAGINNSLRARFRDGAILNDETPEDIQAGLVIKQSFTPFLPNPFAITAERSGILNLWGELDMPDDPWNPNGKRRHGESTIPLPIQRNIDFVRMSKNGRFRTESPLLNDFPDFLDDFKNLFGGTYKVHEGVIYFVPEGSNATELRMQEGSSSVRALFHLNYYLRYIAQEGDILMIDEPELNLHPERQRLMARLLARLVNVGIKVFLTTHSDYLIRELNVLIMLYRKEERLEKIRNEEGYRENELLEADKVRVYTAEQTKEGNGYTLCLADVNQTNGIEVSTFDKTIVQSSSIIENIVYGIS